MPISDEIRSNKVDYKQKYSNLKRKLKILIYENECYQEELIKAQRQLLQVSRDKSYLLDRLIQYENIQSTTSDSDETLSSDSESEQKPKNESKKKKANENNSNESQPNTSSSKKKKPANQTTRSKGANAGKPKLTLPIVASTSSMTISIPSSSTPSTQVPFSAPIIKIEPGLLASSSQPICNSTKTTNMLTRSTSLPMQLSTKNQDGHMTSEELERHLEARRQQLAMLMPEKTPLTVPVELFSNESSSGLPDNEHFIQ